MSQATEALTDRLHELCELLHVSVHRPRMSFKIRGAEVVAKSGGGDSVTLNEKQATRSSWKLMPTEMAAALDRIDTEVRRLMEQYSVRFRSHTADGEDDESFQIRGMYLVPALQVEGLLGRLSELNRELRAIVENWVSDPARFRDALRERLGGDAYAMAEKQIPSLGHLLGTTRIHAVSIPFGANLERVRETAERSLLREARERAIEMVTQISRNLIEEPRRELAEALNGLAARIAEDGTVTNRTLNPTRRALEKLQLFDFVADDELRRRMHSLRSQLDGIVPSEQGSESTELLTALRETAAAAIDEIRIEEQFQSVVVSPRRLSVRRPHAAPV